MAPIVRSGKPLFSGRVSDESGTPSNNLWVGNVSADISDSDLMALFSKHGVVDSVTTYPSRNYAFVYYRRIDDAMAAKQALQGHVIHGSSLKIEFARPAKPCKSLWVSGISESVTKEVLEEEFIKFGEIEEFKLIKEKSTAYVDYFRLEDASQALKNMNGKRMGGGQIRVDFLRSNTAKRDQWPDSRDVRDGRFTNRSVGLPEPWMREVGGKYPELLQSGLHRNQYSQSPGGRRNNGQPSKILWVGYPPSAHVDDQMLHNAMILFGEIESVRSVPTRNFAFVEFRSIEEARRAKEGLQGRLFNDPRITIAYSSSEPGHGKDHPGFHPGGPGVDGPRAGMFNHEPPVQHANPDLFNHPMGSNISGSAQSGGINMSARPFVPQGRSEGILYGPEFGDMTVPHKVPDPNHITQMGGPNWRRPSPAAGVLPLPSPGMKRAGPLSAPWDVFDASHGQSDSKRLRTDTGFPYDVSRGPEINGGSSEYPAIQGKRIITGGTGQGQMEPDYLWRGVISKGGSPVCRARCIPVGENIDFEIPPEVNCSARTGLDMLTKHYAEAIGFEIVFFLPDSEEDFASYTEFLQYLGTRNRAGVAKCEDGTTLFLVPPSDFLYKVLDVAGPERLYGVVLKFPQHAPDTSTVPGNGTLMYPQSSQSHYSDGQHMSSQNEYMVMPPQEENAFQMDRNRVLSEDQLPPHTAQLTSNSESVPMPPASGSNVVVSQGGLTLTPEIIATLASLIPAAAKSSGSDTTQHLLGSSSNHPSLPASTEPDRGMLQQGWTHDQPRHEQITYPLGQVDNQYTQRQLTQIQTYTSGLNTPNVAGGLQAQDPAFNFAQQGSRASVPFEIPANTANPAVNSQVGQYNQYEDTQSNHMGNGLAHVSDSLGSYGSYTYQQPASNVPQAQTAASYGSITGATTEFAPQAQQIQHTPFGTGQDTGEAHMDKDQRYQSTLQFAANLLFQIQQQQQQPQTMGTPTQGSSNQ